jgi:FtsZ-binding cell division protein ZapB
MNALEVAIKNLEAKVTQITDFVADGKAVDFENYAALVGEIKGLKYAINELKDTNDKLLQDTDD